MNRTWPSGKPVRAKTDQSQSRPRLGNAAAISNATNAGARSFAVGCATMRLDVASNRAILPTKKATAKRESLLCRVGPQLDQRFNATVRC